MGTNGRKGTIKKKFTIKDKLNLQLYIAVAVFLTGIGLLIAGFIVNPLGIIHNSVLVAFGECCTFAGALIGVDYRYKFKQYIVTNDYPPHHSAYDDVEEINQLENDEIK